MSNELKIMSDVDKMSISVRYKISIGSQCQYAKIRLHSLDNQCKREYSKHRLQRNGEYIRYTYITTEITITITVAYMGVGVLYHHIIS